MSDQQIPRRAFVQGVLGLTGAALCLPVANGATLAQSPRSTANAGAVKLGIASYSLREFDRAKAIEMIREMRVPYVNIKSVHLDYNLSPAELQAGRREFESAGLTVVGGGTITFDQDTDAGVRKYFEYARNAGMPLMVATANPAFLPRIERFSREYGIKVAIHNHGPEDRHYPSPYDVLRYVKDMHPNMGACLDVGHTVRAGADVSKAIRDLGPRLLDMHMKDLTDLTNRDSQVAVGEGKIPVADIFRTLIATNYQGYVNLEYEIHSKDPLPGMKVSVAHMRGILAGLASTGTA